MFKRTCLLLAVLAFAAGARDSWGQQRTITGTVTGADGAGLAAASVTVAGTRRGVTTDARGAFALAVPAGEVRLAVSRLGYASRQVVVPAGETTASVRLQPDVLNLEGLVVTGVATSTARRNLPQSVAVVSGEELERVPAQTLEKALQGKVAGANIVANTGAPGGGLQIQLRGVSSIGGNADPLFVIDGVIVSNAQIPSGMNVVSQASPGLFSSVEDQMVNRLADINPNDIESVEILKGASAAAIYGSKAANGVVVIRTRRGRAGAPRVTLSQRFGFFEQSNRLGSREWTREAAVDFGWVTEDPDDGALYAGNYFNEDGSAKAVYDNERAVFGRRAPGAETSFSVSGGTERTRYFVTGLWKRDEGIAENTGYNKQNVRVSVGQQLGSRINLDVSAGITHSVAARGLTGNDNNGVSYYSVIAFTPSFFDLSRRSDGTFPENPWIHSNPVQTAALATNDEDTWRTLTSATLSVDMVKGDRHSLRFVANGGVDYFQQRNELHFPRELQFEPTDDGFPGTAVLGVGNNTNLNGTASLVHQLTLDAVKATTSVGSQYEEVDLEISRTFGRNLPSGVRLPGLAAKVDVQEGRQRVRDLGVYVQEELLLLDERLNLTGALRADRSSANADAGQYYFFPKAAASYRFGRVGPLHDFKLRAAYGATGNRPFYGQRFTPAATAANIEGKTGISVGGPVGAADLRPERNTEIEGGFDAVAAGGRARFELTGYQKTVTDFIIQPPLTPSIGFGAYTLNGGSFRSRGVEMMLEATPLRGGAFNWTTRTTYSMDRAEVLSLPLGLPQYNPGFHYGPDFGAYRIKPGVSPTAIWGYVKDAEGNAVEAPIGNSQPDFRMSFANDLELRGWTFSSLFDWSSGADNSNYTHNYYDSGFNAPDFNACNTQESCPGLERWNQWLDNEGNVYIEDASFVKLRELTLGYELPSRLLGRIPGRVERTRVSLSGRDLYTWTRYSGLDPEVSNFGNRAVGRNIDLTPFPPSRSFWLGVEVGF